MTQTKPDIELDLENIKLCDLVLVTCEDMNTDVPSQRFIQRLVLNTGTGEIGQAVDMLFAQADPLSEIEICVHKATGIHSKDGFLQVVWSDPLVVFADRPRDYEEVAGWTMPDVPIHFSLQATAIADLRQVKVNLQYEFHDRSRRHENPIVCLIHKMHLDKAVAALSQKPNARTIVARQPEISDGPILQIEFSGGKRVWASQKVLDELVEIEEDAF